MKSEKSMLEVVIYPHHHFFLFVEYLRFIFISLKKLSKKLYPIPNLGCIKDKETIKIY